MREIGDWAFSGTRLNDVQIPVSVQTVGERAFEWCYDLEIVNFQNGSQLNNISEDVFDECDNLVAVTAQSSLEPVVRAAVPEDKLVLRSEGDKEGSVLT